MPYATQQDLIDRFGEDELIQLTDRDGDGAIDADVMDTALTDADAEIDGYLATKYQLPLATVPGVITQLACDVARYRLYDEHATEQVRNRYKDAVAFLTRLSRGEVSLGLATPPASSSGEVQTTSGDRKFNRTTMKGLL